MKINKNDPRLTAYILNELKASERNIIESAIKADPELANEVALLKKSVDVFYKFEQAQDYQLNPEQKTKVLAQISTQVSSTKSWSWWAIGSSLATASLALILYQQKAHERFEYAVTVVKPAAQSKKSEQPKIPAPAAPAAARLAESEEAPAKAKDSAKDSATESLKEVSDQLADKYEAEIATNNSPSVTKGAGGAALGGFASGAVAPKPMLAERKAKNEVPSQNADLSAVSKSRAAAPAEVSRSLERARQYELEVNLGQFLPEEVDDADININMNLVKDLKKCFTDNLLKYKRYNLKLSLKWQIFKSRVTKVELIDTTNNADVSKEVIICVQQAVTVQNWSDVKYVVKASKIISFEALLSIVSQ